MAMDMWKDLKCNCCGVSTTFMRTMRVRWKQGGGLVEAPEGYQCQQCHGIVDAEVLVAQARQEEKLQEVREAEAELEATRRASVQRKAGVIPAEPAKAEK